MTNKDKTVGCEVEYNTLRAEILQNQKNMLQIITFSLVATAAILSIAANGIPVEGKVVCADHKSLVNWLFVVPLVILVPGYYLYLNQVAACFKLGAYIRVFLESKCEQLNYETLWSNYEISESKLYHYSAHLIFLLPMLVCIFVFGHQTIIESWCPVIITSFFTFIVVVPRTCFFMKIFNLAEQDQKWEDVQKEQKST
jgi:hypothetical protein